MDGPLGFVELLAVAGLWLARVQSLQCQARRMNGAAVRADGGALTGRNDLPVLEELGVDKRE
jgi:hypothetical protein